MSHWRYKLNNLRNEYRINLLQTYRLANTHARTQNTFISTVYIFDVPKLIMYSYINSVFFFLNFSSNAFVLFNLAQWVRISTNSYFNFCVNWVSQDLNSWHLAKSISMINQPFVRKKGKNRKREEINNVYSTICPNCLKKKKKNYLSKLINQINIAAEVTKKFSILVIYLEDDEIS